MVMTRHGMTLIDDVLDRFVGDIVMPAGVWLEIVYRPNQMYATPAQKHQHYHKPNHPEPCVNPSGALDNLVKQMNMKDAQITFARHVPYGTTERAIINLIAVR
jgi:hypothetical protein